LLLQQLQRQPAAPLLQGLPPLLDRRRSAPKRPRRRRPPQEQASRPRRRRPPRGGCGSRRRRGLRPRLPRPAPAPSFLPDLPVSGLRRAVARLPRPPVLTCRSAIRSASPGPLAAFGYVATGRLV
ncbi:hypothetical protein BAE44_0007265, partial [Dichanthelium oligosanthes]